MEKKLTGLPKKEVSQSHHLFMSRANLKEIFSHYFGGLYVRLEDHHAFLNAGGLAFSLFVCIIPFILIIFSVLGSILDSNYMQYQINTLIDTIIPYDQYSEFVKKIILPLTCGRVIKINRDQWEEITSIVVSFSEKETSYNLTFFCIDKKNWFILSGGGAQYNFKGQDYPLTVSTKGSCILMVIPPDMSTIYTESFSIFKGWRKR